jgi:hypothetical protein
MAMPHILLASALQFVFEVTAQTWSRIFSWLPFSDDLAILKCSERTRVCPQVRDRLLSHCRLRLVQPVVRLGWVADRATVPTFCDTTCLLGARAVPP